MKQKLLNITDDQIKSILSDKAKENLRSLQFTQGEMQKLQASLAIYNTAAAAYSTALKNELDE